MYQLESCSQAASSTTRAVMVEPPRLPPEEPTQINILEITAAVRIWVQLLLAPRGLCMCGRYTFRGVCGHDVHQETLLCGASRTPSGMPKCCHLLTPTYYARGYVLRMVCEMCYAAPA